MSALHHAAQNNYPAIIDALLAGGADPTLESVNPSFTPLSLAASLGHVEGLESLLSSRRIGEQDKARALHEAGMRGHAAACRKLLERGADPTLVVGKGIVPLEQAFLHESRAVVEAYLEYGAEPPVWASARLGLVDHLRKALQAGRDSEARAPGGARALHFAARAGQVEAVGILLGAGADASVSTRNGDTPLHGAVEARSEKIVELLISREWT